MYIYILNSIQYNFSFILFALTDHAYDNLGGMYVWN
jgi:hypothetical protein